VIVCVILNGTCALWWHRLQPVRDSDCSLQRIVGQVGNLRPIVNRPAECKRMSSPWFKPACLVPLCTTRPENLCSPRRIVGQACSLRPIFNRPARNDREGLVAAMLLCGAANPGCSRLSSRLAPLTRHENKRIKAGCTQDYLPHRQPARDQARAPQVVPRPHVALGTTACCAETSGRLDAWPSPVHDVGAPHGGGPCRHAS
jgi:hypothetical protein